MPARLSAVLMASALFALPSVAHAKHHRRARARSWGFQAWYRGPLPVPVVRGEGTPTPRREAEPARPAAPARSTLAERLAQTPVLHAANLARKQWVLFNGLD